MKRRIAFVFIIIVLFYGGVLFAGEKVRFYLKDDSVIIGEIVKEYKNKYIVKTEFGKRAVIWKRNMVKMESLKASDYEEKKRFILKGGKVVVGRIVGEDRNKYMVILESGRRKYIYKRQVEKIEDMKAPKKIEDKSKIAGIGKKRRYKHLVFFGIGPYIPIGSLAEYVGVGISARVSYAFDSLRVYKKIKVYLNPFVGYGFLSTKKHVQKFSVLEGGVKIGYVLPIRKRMYIIPYLGFSMLFIDVKTEYVQDSFRNFTLDIGGHYNYYYRRYKIYIGRDLCIGLIKDKGYILENIWLNLSVGYKIK